MQDAQIYSISGCQTEWIYGGGGGGGRVTGIQIVPLCRLCGPLRIPQTDAAVVAKALSITVTSQAHHDNVKDLSWMKKGYLWHHGPTELW